MARRLIIGLALASAATISAAGCGSGSSKPRANAPGPEVAWARHVCDTLGGTGKLQLPVIDPKDNLKSKQAIVGFLSGLSTQLKVVQTSLVAAGDPPVADGRQTLNVALINLSRTQTAVTAASADLSKARVTDARSLQAAITQAGVVLTRFQSYQGPTKDLRTNPALNKAFDQAPSCQIHNL